MRASFRNWNARCGQIRGNEKVPTQKGVWNICFFTNYRNSQTCTILEMVDISEIKASVWLVIGYIKFKFKYW